MTYEPSVSIQCMKTLCYIMKDNGQGQCEQKTTIQRMVTFYVKRWIIAKGNI
jgi:hypothetical protein